MLWGNWAHKVLEAFTQHIYAVNKEVLWLLLRTFVWNYCIINNEPWEKKRTHLRYQPFLCSGHDDEQPLRATKSSSVRDFFCSILFFFNLISLGDDAAISQGCCVCALFSSKLYNPLSGSGRGQQSQILHAWKFNANRWLGREWARRERLKCGIH